MVLIAEEARVGGVAELAEGDLRSVPFRQLLFAYAVHRRSAILELATRQIWKRVIFDTGAPVDCQSNLLHDTLGKFMLGRGGITEDRYRECLAETVRSGRRMGEVLIERGVVSASELYRTLQQNLATKLLDCFLWRQGTFRAREASEPHESALRVNTAQLLYTGVTKLTSEADVLKAIEPILDKTLVVSPAPPLAGSDIRLKLEDRRIAAGFRHGRTIVALAQEKGVPVEAVMRIAYGLLEVGLLVPAEAAKSVSVRSPAEPARDRPVTGSAARNLTSAALSPPPARDSWHEPSPLEQEDTQPPAAPASEDTQTLREDLMRVYLEHRKMDAFDLLGLDESATEEAIERAYLERSWRFAPPRFAADGLDDLGDKARQLALAVGRAFSRVGTPSARAALIARRRDRRLASTSGAAASKHPSGLLDAELLFRKGKRLLELGSHESAIEQLQLAADCEPQNATYQAELAWATYLSSPSTSAPGMLTALTQVINRLDPRCGVAYLYQGQIEADLGHDQDALHSLKIAARLLRGDARPSEALRDLRSKGVVAPGEKRSMLARLLG